MQHCSRNQQIPDKGSVTQTIFSHPIGKDFRYWLGKGKCGKFFKVLSDQRDFSFIQGSVVKFTNCNGANAQIVNANAEAGLFYFPIIFEKFYNDIGITYYSLIFPHAFSLNVLAEISRSFHKPHIDKKSYWDENFLLGISNNVSFFKDSTEVTKFNSLASSASSLACSLLLTVIFSVSISTIKNNCT